MDQLNNISSNGVELNNQIKGAMTYVLPPVYSRNTTALANL